MMRLTHNRPARGGFTLLELLLAIGLCGLLMTATMSAVFQSWKFRIHGDRSVETSEQLRGVYSDMRLDLHNAISPVSATNGSIPAGVPAQAFKMLQQLVASDNQSQLEQTDYSEQFLNLNVNGDLEPIHFFGNSQCFVVLTDRASHRFPATEARGKAQVSHLNHIAWAVSPAALRIPFHTRDGRQVLSSFPKTRQPGITRWQRSFDPRTPAVSPPQQELILPNISGVAFRYFDGTDWATQWNSGTTHRLPAAVEVCLTFESDTDHTFVIRLPQARKASS